jgi:ATP-dependent RNA helicase DDX52/ROK1
MGGFANEEEVHAFRNRLSIKVKGGDVVPPCATFAEMDISADAKALLLRNIEESHWKEPTAIQMQAVPIQLSGRDVLAAAPTGSGKTAAFLLPVLANLKPTKVCAGLQALVLAPTRELAEQIHREAAFLAAGRKLGIKVLNKTIMNQALDASNNVGGGGGVLNRASLLITTPMRLLVLLRAKAVDLSTVEVVIMDEVDKLFELEGGDEEVPGEPVRSSFLSQVDEILASCSHASLRRSLFSATMGPMVHELAGAILKNPVSVSIGRQNTGANTIDQKLVFTGNEEGKLLAMRNLIREGLKPPCLLFLQSKDRAKALYKELVYDGINVDVIHSERTQQQRDEAVRQFRTGEIWVLICTDLIARGLDFKGVQMVINYDLPNTAVAYIHRIGRTGRAGRQGTSVTFFTEKDMPNLRSIANVVKQSGCAVPAWMLSIKQLKTHEKKALRLGGGPDRASINTDLPAQQTHRQRKEVEGKSKSNSKSKTSTQSTKKTASPSPVKKTVAGQKRKVSFGEN